VLGSGGYGLLNEQRVPLRVSLENVDKLWLLHLEN